MIVLAQNTLFYEWKDDHNSKGLGVVFGMERGVGDKGKVQNNNDRMMSSVGDGVTVMWVMDCVLYDGWLGCWDGIVLVCVFFM